MPLIDSNTIYQTQPKNIFAPDHICDLSDAEAMRSNLEALLRYVTRAHPLDHIGFTAGDGIKIGPVAELEVEAI
jgi:hypothetical protein